MLAYDKFTIESYNSSLMTFNNLQLKSMNISEEKMKQNKIITIITFLLSATEALTTLSNMSTGDNPPGSGVNSVGS